MAVRDATRIDDLQVRAATVPTDAPESDGTFEWDRTTVVVVTARAGDERGFGWTYADGATARTFETPAAYPRFVLQPGSTETVATPYTTCLSWKLASCFGSPNSDRIARVRLSDAAVRSAVAPLPRTTELHRMEPAAGRPRVR